MFDAYNIKLNSLIEFVKIKSGCISSKTYVFVALSAINTNYKINYCLNGGEWNEGFTPVSLHNVNTTVRLPNSLNLSKDGYGFSGWYTSEDFSTSALTEVSAGIEEDITLYAKWREVETADASNIVSKILNMTENGKIVVTGEFNASKSYLNTIYQVKNALNELETINSNIMVVLDLSGVTNLTAMGEYGYDGYDIFERCFNLAGVILPNTLTKIGKESFQFCKNLVNITIPENVTTIGYRAFYGCKNLTSLG